MQEGAAESTAMIQSWTTNIRHTTNVVTLCSWLVGHWESLTENTELQRELAERFIRPLMRSDGSGVLLRWDCCCGCGRGLQPPPPLGWCSWSSGCVLLLLLPPRWRGCSLLMLPPPWWSCRCSGGQLLLLPPPPPWWRSCSLLPPWCSCGTLVIPWVRCHANWTLVSSTAQSASVRAGTISIGQSGVFPWVVLHNQLKSVDACSGGIAVVQCAGTLMENWDVEFNGCSFCFISKTFWKLLLGRQ